MNKFFKYILCAAVLLMTGGLSSCVNDLDVEPIDPSLQSDVTPEQLFNKCYSVFATSGNNGGDDNVDVDGLDGGFQHKYRQMWNSNELTTDEAICGWGDEGIPSYCHNSSDASHPMLRGYYYGLCIGITFCNQYLEVYGDYNATMTAEVRFLRAFQFYLLTDAFGNIPFTTTISGENPEQYTPNYQWITSVPSCVLIISKRFILISSMFSIIVISTKHTSSIQAAALSTRP